MIGSFLQWVIGVSLATAIAASVGSPTPRASPSPGPSPSPITSARSEIPEELLKIRDPFKSPIIVKTETEAMKPDLERFPVEKYKVVGVYKSPDHLRAMILTPESKTYFVHENSKIGMRNGIVRKITVEGIYVREKTVNILGQPETIDTVLKIPPLYQSTMISELMEKKKTSSGTNRFAKP